MAVIHPQDRIAHTRRDPRPMHPALGLLLGFGFIFVVAMLVHLLFSLVG